MPFEKLGIRVIKQKEAEPERLVDAEFEEE